MALQAVNGEERILLGGYTRNGGNGPIIFVLVRNSSSGLLDQTFGNNGISTTEVNGNDRIEDIAIDQQNRIVAVGSTAAQCSWDAVVGRYYQDGTLDPTFSSDGLFTLDIYGADNRAKGVAIQPDGSILAVGTASTPDGTFQDLALFRVTTDGLLDQSFGPSTLGGGIVTTRLYGKAYLFGRTIALQNNGQIVAAASGPTANGDGTYVVRYDP